MEALPLCAASCGVFTRLFRRRFDAPNVGHIHALLASRNKMNPIKVAMLADTVDRSVFAAQTRAITEKEIADMLVLFYML